jgi:hypothetical protein
MTSRKPADTARAPLPPRWFIRIFWAVHRAMLRLTGGRLGLRRATDAQWGMMRLTLNLQANPDTTVELADGSRAVRGRPATPEERPRLWSRWAEYDGAEKLESWASRRSRETAVVILEPRKAG